MHRLWQVDFVRGVALLLMLLFNWSFALDYIGVFTIASGDLYWFWFPRFIGAMFVFVAGFSFSLSYSKIKNKDMAAVYKKYLARGAKIFSLGLLITLVTYIFATEGTVYFGILHLIGLSVILAVVFRNLEKVNLLLGALFILGGVYLHYSAFTFNWLLWLGFKPYGLYTFDYFPVLPWFGVFLIGMYSGGVARIKAKAGPKISGPLQFLGRHTLPIYILHQPVLFAALWLLGYIVL